MGTTNGTVHVHGADRDAFLSFLPQVILQPAYVLLDETPSISIFASPDNDFRDQVRLAQTISKQLKTPTLRHMVYDSDFTVYEIFRGGRSTAHFNSNPTYFDNPPDASLRTTPENVAEIEKAFGIKPTATLIAAHEPYDESKLGQRDEYQEHRRTRDLAAVWG